MRPGAVLFLAALILAPSAPASVLRTVEAIDFSGHNVKTDSYDSSDPLHSNPGGLYPTGDTNKLLAGGDLVAGTWITNSSQVGYLKVKGSLRTGTNGTVYLGPLGSVGDRAWVEGGNLGIQPGHLTNDAPAKYPQVVLPSSFGWYHPYCPAPIIVDGITYSTYILMDGDYFLGYWSEIVTNLYIGSNVNCRVLLYGNIDVLERITIATGAKASFYSWGTNFTVRGYGIINESGRPGAFRYFGLSSNTNVSLRHNASFVGTIYAPSARVSVGGGGNDMYDIIGCITAKSMRFGGHFNLHFDEDLYRFGPFPPIITNSAASLLVGAGQDAVIGTVASGSGPQSYRWSFRPTQASDHSFIPGASDAFVTVSNSGALNAGEYTVWITNEFGLCTSESATLTVTAPPLLTRQSTNVNALLGGNALFSFVPDGSPPFGFALRHPTGYEIVATTNWGFTLTNVQPPDAGGYSLVVTNSWGAVTSAPIALTILATPAATLGTVSFAESYSWQYVQFPVDGVTGAKYAIETSADLTTWERVKTNVVPFLFSEQKWSWLPQKFYRAVYLP